MTKYLQEYIDNQKEFDAAFWKSETIDVDKSLQYKDKQEKLLKLMSSEDIEYLIQRTDNAQGKSYYRTFLDKKTVAAVAVRPVKIQSHTNYESSSTYGRRAVACSGNKKTKYELK